METAEELEGQIADARQRLNQDRSRTTELMEEVERAGERQRLREVLEELHCEIWLARRTNAYHEGFIEAVDQDSTHREDHDPNFDPEGWVPSVSARTEKQRNPPETCEESSLGNALDYSEYVDKGEYEWRLQGLSWLVSALKQQDNTSSMSQSTTFSVGGEWFCLVYNPAGDAVDNLKRQTGSLAIQHRSWNGINFRYRLSIKDASGEFTQWGATGEECHPYWDAWGKAFGPDVQDHREEATTIDEVIDKEVGIFDLSHDELLESQWVQNDTLTVKVQIELRKDIRAASLSLKPTVDVPAPTIDTDLLLLLNRGLHSDVTFLVEGEVVKAHAALLSIRSEVFEKQLSCGMRESLTREIVIEDCDLPTFKALLKFLYTDDLTCAEDVMQTMKADAARGTRDKCFQDMCIEFTQNLLAVSHKYQVSRLQRWCEQQLCKFLSVNEACSILCQAHLHEAKHLEQVCLAFIKTHVGAVVATPAFGRLTRTWPEVMLKINMHLAGISENAAAQAIEAQQESRQQRQIRADPSDDEEDDLDSTPEIGDEAEGGGSLEAAHDAAAEVASAKDEVSGADNGNLSFWQAYMDPNSGKTWWWHEATQGVSWEYPPECP